VRHPSKCAELLTAKMTRHDARVWLVNTGWGGGAYGVGRRISFKRTRAFVDAIHTGALAKAATQRDPIFGFDVAIKCRGVPPEILMPRGAWAEASVYDANAQKRAGLFRENFKKYEANQGRGSGMKMAVSGGHEHAS